MHLTEKEKIVYDFLKREISNDYPAIPYVEMLDNLKMDSKVLRGVLSSLTKKKLVVSDFQKDAAMSFIRFYE